MINIRFKASSHFAAGRTEAISLACCVCMNINAIARTHTWKIMRPAPCNLRGAACGILCRRPQHRPQHRPAPAQAAAQAGPSTGRSTGPAQAAAQAAALAAALAAKRPAARGLRPAAKYEPVFNQ